MRFLRLARDVHRLWDCHLHPVRQLVLADPGQRLGIAIDEHGPNWRQLETMDIAALELARGITELFQEQYYRLMNQRTEGR